jgi:hypothetical protein
MSNGFAMARQKLIAVPCEIFFSSIGGLRFFLHFHAQDGMAFIAFLNNAEEIL